MGTRGPKPAGNKLKPVKQSVPRRPNPPRGMDSKARHVWKMTVNAYPPDHFKPQHRELLRMYCSACVIQKKAENEAEKVNYTDTNPRSGVTKESHWVGISEKMAARATALSVKLGISVNNTTAARGVKGSVSAPKSKRAGLIFEG